MSAVKTTEIMNRLIKIQQMPVSGGQLDKSTPIDEIHESDFRSANILQEVRGMMDRGDSVETIQQVIGFLMSRKKHS